MVLISCVVVLIGNNFNMIAFLKLVRALSTLIIVLLIILLPIYFYFEDFKKLVLQKENKGFNKPLFYTRLIAIFGLTTFYFLVSYIPEISSFDLQFNNPYFDFFGKAIIYFCLVGIIIFLGFIIWSKDFEEKFTMTVINTLKTKPEPLKRVDLNEEQKKELFNRYKDYVEENSRSNFENFINESEPNEKIVLISKGLNKDGKYVNMFPLILDLYTTTKQEVQNASPKEISKILAENFILKTREGIREMTIYNVKKTYSKYIIKRYSE